MESGVVEMTDREEKMIQQACDDFATLPERDASKSPLLEENLAAKIAQHALETGADPEDAAEEVMLNQTSLLGNQLPHDVDAADAHDDIDDKADNAAGSHVQTTAAKKSTAMSSEAFRTWVEEVVCSVKALNFQVSANKRPVGDGGEISLVLGKMGEPTTSSSSESGQQAESESVFWVHWKFAGSLGRPVSLDHENRVKCIVATGKLRDPRDYKSVHVIITATGVKMERTRGFKGQLRPQMPAVCMRLHDMHKNVLISRDAAERDNNHLTPLEKFDVYAGGMNTCFVCASSAFQSAEGSSMADCVQVCPFCLLPGHLACRKDLVKHVQSNEDLSFPSEIHLESLELPDVFDTDMDGSRPRLGCNQLCSLVFE